MTGIERLRDIAEDRYSGGMIHISVQRLREICEQIEAEAGVETVKAEAIRAADNRRVELCAALGIDTDTGWSDAMAKMVKRLMPEGMEWPKFDDGDPVEFGDEFQNAHGGASVLRTAVIKDCRDSLGGDFYWKLGKGKNAVTLKSGERVKRHAPKVLDADGVEIREGDTVWDEHGDELVVLAVYGVDVHCRYAEYEDQICDNGTWDPLQLTHRAPVLDADGKPLREGDTVWDTNGNGPYSIQKIENDGVIRIDGRGLDYFGYEFVRERPDSWEKVWSDVYQGRTGSREMACRCMALAESGQR